MKPEDVKPEAITQICGREESGGFEGLYVPAHEVGAIIKECMEDMREKTEAVYESWHRAKEVARRDTKVEAWLVKAEELEKMR